MNNPADDNNGAMDDLWAEALSEQKSTSSKSAADAVFQQFGGGDVSGTMQDIDLIMEHFTAPVYWCLCPRSNRYISRLEPPVELLRRNGLNICLGTDSLASNDRLSVLEEMKLLSGVPLPELLGWATAGGASALGMDDMGRVAVGLRPGLSVITGIDYGRMTLTAASAIRRLA